MLHGSSELFIRANWLDLRLCKVTQHNHWTQRFLGCREIECLEEWFCPPYSWVCLIPRWYGWNCLWLTEFAHKVTSLLWVWTTSDSKLNDSPEHYKQMEVTTNNLKETLGWKLDASNTSLLYNDLWQMYVSFSCVCPITDHEFCHNIVEVPGDPWDNIQVDPQTPLMMLRWNSLSITGQTHEKLTSVCSLWY